MLIKLHSQATTTPKVRAAIQASDEPAWVLAERHGTTEQTVWKWRKRETVEDRSHTPHRIQTTLMRAQEAVAVALRKTLLESHEDLLAPRPPRADLARGRRTDPFAQGCGVQWLPVPFSRRCPGPTGGRSQAALGAHACPGRNSRHSHSRPAPYLCFAAGLWPGLAGNDWTAAGSHPGRDDPALCPPDRLTVTGRGERGGRDAEAALKGGR